MNTSGLGLDDSRRRLTSLIVAVVTSVVALAGPANALPDRVEDVSNALWPHVSTNYGTIFGRSWS